ncbi:MAG: SDR family oxidoreductase [Deltaproteobacteria bacterium]|nr:SDR family oxidoreductase [Deltaproteobacteria bacterium]
MELKDQIAIVTGAGRGIGEAIALTFAREGAHVVVNDIHLDDAISVARKIEAMGRKSLPFKADVSNKSEVKSMGDEILKRFGTIDILVNNAGIGGSSLIVKDIPEQVWDQVMAINLKGVFLCCQTVIPTMIERRRGKIVNIASLAARRMSFLGGADYTASKYGVVGLSHHLAYELAYYGINVNVVCPGATLTKMTDEKAPQDVKEKIAARVPLGRWCSPEDQAEAVLFLASDRAKMITGHILDVDGGQLLGFGNYPEDIERRMKASQT